MLRFAGRYISRCTPAQKNIYYLTAPSRQLAEASAYYEVFAKTGTEVLFMYAPIDDFVMTNLAEYNGRKLVTCESANIEDLTAAAAEAKAVAAAEEGGEDGESKEADAEAAAEEAQEEGGSDGAALSAEQQTELITWMQVTLADKVSEVKACARSPHPPTTHPQYHAVHRGDRRRRGL